MLDRDLADWARAREEHAKAPYRGPVPPDVAPEAGSDNVSSLVQNLGAPSIDELEKIIGELQQARTYLKSESERIERETVGYTELSQTAMESVRIIAETVGEWRKAGHPVRSTHGA